MQNPKLAEYFDDGRQYIRLLDIEAEIGHTFVHYLYTGQYQTVGTSVLALKEQYRRSVLTYKAALRYCVPHLEGLSKQRMEHLGSAIGIFDILAVSSHEYFNIQWYSSWYAGYLEEMVTAAFTADNGIFSRDEFSKCLGVSPCFLVYMMQLINRVYSDKIQRYIERAAETKTKTVKPSSNELSCEKCVERSHRKKQALKESSGAGSWSEHSKVSIENSSPADTTADQSSMSGEQFEGKLWMYQDTKTEEDMGEWDRFSIPISGSKSDTDVGLGLLS